VNALLIFLQRTVRFPMEQFPNHADHERRLIRRHEIKTPLRIRVYKSPGPDEDAQSLNVSEYGLYFTTDAPLQTGAVVEVAICMPQQVSGEETDEWRCIGRVVRVERIESGIGTLGIGVRFDCYEVARAEARRLAKDAKLHLRVTLPIVPGSVT
jgi:hypothetical protein